MGGHQRGHRTDKVVQVQNRVENQVRLGSRGAHQGLCGEHLSITLSWDCHGHSCQQTFQASASQHHSHKVQSPAGSVPLATPRSHATLPVNLAALDPHTIGIPQKGKE